MLTFILANKIALAAIAVPLFQFIGKAIPDDKRGVLGVVRKVAKVAGLYIQNNSGAL